MKGKAYQAVACLLKALESAKKALMVSNDNHEEMKRTADLIAEISAVLPYMERSVKSPKRTKRDRSLAASFLKKSKEISRLLSNAKSIATSLAASGNLTPSERGLAADLLSASSMAKSAVNILSKAAYSITGGDMSDIRLYKGSYSISFYLGDDLVCVISSARDMSSFFGMPLDLCRKKLSRCFVKHGGGTPGSVTIGGATYTVFFVYGKNPNLG